MRFYAIGQTVFAVAATNDLPATNGSPVACNASESGGPGAPSATSFTLFEIVYAV